ncbi:MAG: hypothetical protein ABFD96_25310 [Armatimonadia bacterium]
MTDLPPTPWRINDTGSAFKVSDARGRVLAYFYYRREEALRSQYLAQDQARQLAVAFARLSKPAEESQS